MYPRCGKLNPDGLHALSRADDYEQVKAVAEFYSVSMVVPALRTISSAVSFMHPIIPLPSYRHLSCDDCVEDIREYFRTVLCLLCTTVVQNYKHTGMSITGELAPVCFALVLLLASVCFC